MMALSFVPTRRDASPLIIKSDDGSDTLIRSPVESGVRPDSNVCAERREFLNLLDWNGGSRVQGERTGLRSRDSARAKLSENLAEVQGRRAKREWLFPRALSPASSLHSSACKIREFQPLRMPI